MPNSATVDQLGNPILRPDDFGKAYDRLDKIAQQVTKQKQATASGILNQQQQDAIGGILGDLSRVKLANSIGKSVGSNTVQNAASQNLLSEVASGAGLPGLADSPLLMKAFRPADAVYKLFGTDREIRDKIAQVVLNPQSAQSQAIISRMTKPQRGLLANVSAQVGGLLGM